MIFKSARGGFIFKWAILQIAVKYGFFPFCFQIRRMGKLWECIRKNGIVVGHFFCYLGFHDSIFEIVKFPEEQKKKFKC